MKSLLPVLLMLSPLIPSTAIAQVGPAVAPSQREAARDVADSGALGLLLALHAHDIEAAALFAGRQTSPAVRNYAERIAAEARDAQSRTRDVAMRAGISPQQTPMVVAFETTAKSQRERLGGLDLTAFERGYVEASLQMATALQERIDRELLPMVSDTAIAAHLGETRENLVRRREDGAALAAQRAEQ